MEIKIKTTKLTSNPIFIQFLNWQKDKEYIALLLSNILPSYTDDYHTDIIESRIGSLAQEDITPLDIFHEKFKSYMDITLGNKDISEEFLYFLNNAFKYIKEEVDTYANDVTHKAVIIDPKGRWLEGLICYNFILTCNYFTLNIIKKCPICGSYFSHKGQYAKYCSDSCKESGMTKK